MWGVWGVWGVWEVWGEKEFMPPSLPTPPTPYPCPIPNTPYPIQPLTSVILLLIYF
nr:hypothetical protein [Nostoc sp. ChiSLP01]